MRIFRQRPVQLRLHLLDPAPSIEGIFVGYEAGHYVLKNSKVLRGANDAEALEGEAWVPRDRVIFAQPLGGVQ